MNKQLMTIVLESAAFWELAGDELVDPDAAAEQNEGLVSTLHEMTPEEKAEFLAFAKQYADDEEENGDPDRVRFFRSIPKVLGLE